MDFNLPSDYEINNREIINRIRLDLSANKNIHYMFLGAVGSGKTHLARIIRQFYTKQGVDVKFVEARNSYKEYLRMLGSEYTDKVEAIRKREQVLRKPYVIYDDIGNEKPATESAHSFVGDLLEDRYMWIKKGFGKMTILTSNLDETALRRFYGDRVVDRLVEVFTIMKFKSESFRKKKMEIVGG